LGNCHGKKLPAQQETACPKELQRRKEHMLGIIITTYYLQANKIIKKEHKFIVNILFKLIKRVFTN